MRSLRTSLLAAAAALISANPGVARAQGPKPECRVSEATGDDAVVRITPSQRGVLKKGDVLDVYDDARVFYLPLTHGEVPLVREQKIVASVVVIDLQGDVALARIFQPHAGVKGIALKGRLAVPNPVRPYENQPPVFVKDVVTPAGGAGWRRPIDMKLEVANEPGERVVYVWSAPQGGALAAERTTLPHNRWLAPAKPGRYTVTVEATDAAGKVARHSLELESKGIAGPGGHPGTDWKARRTFGIQARFTGVRDVAFDKAGDTWVLENLGGFTSSEQRLTVLGWDGEEVGRGTLQDTDVVAMAVSDDALYCVDRNTNTVKRYTRTSADPAATIGAFDRVIGTKGSSGPGRLARPTDIAVSPDGAIVYVLDADQKIVHVFTSAGRLLQALGSPAREKDRDLSDLENPTAIATGEDGILFVLDDGKQQKRVVSWKDGLPLADFEAGAAGEELRGLAVDPISGEIYVLDRAGGCVKRFARNGATISKSKPAEGSIEQLEKSIRIRMDGTRDITLIDREGAALVRLDEQLGFLGRSGGIRLGTDLRIAASPEGEVVALDQDSRLVTRFDRQGFVLARFGGGDTLPKPIGVAVDGAGEVFVLDAETASVAKFTRLGGLTLVSTQVNQKPGMELKEVRDIQASSDRDWIMVAQSGKVRTLNLMSPQLVSSHNWPTKSSPSSLEFENVRSAVLLGKTGDQPGATGSFWVVDEKGERLLKTYFGESLAEVEKLDKAREVAASVAGFVFVCDQGAKVVKVYDGRGGPLGKIEDSEKCPKPLDLALDDYGRVFIYDTKTERIVEFVDTQP